MAKTSNPYGVSLFEYKGSNFSGTLATYPVNPNTSVFNNAQNTVGADPDTTGISATPLGLCTGDLVTFAASSDGINANITNADPWSVVSGSRGYLAAAVSLAFADPQAAFNYPRSILGVFQGVQYQPPQGQTVRSAYWPDYVGAGVNPSVSVNTGVVATVNDLADCIFKVQCNGPLGSTAAQAMTSIGKLFGFVDNGGTTAGSSPQGQSILALDAVQGAYALVSSNTTATPPNKYNPYVSTVLPIQCAPFRLIGLAPIQGNSWTDPYPDVLVMINNHMWKPGQPA